MVYKIGITENVLDRWKGKRYSYKTDPYDSWEKMVVLFVGADSMSCALVESFLIHRFGGRAGCRNCSAGGETAKPGDGPFFTYCVYRLAGPPGLHHAGFGKKREQLVLCVLNLLDFWFLGVEQKIFEGRVQNPASKSVEIRRNTNSYVEKPILTSKFVEFFFLKNRVEIMIFQEMQQKKDIVQELVTTSCVLLVRSCHTCPLSPRSPPMLW